MKKIFTVSLRLPVSLEVEADDHGGEVNVMRVIDVRLPSLSDVRDANDDESLAAIDEAFENAKEA